MASTHTLAGGTPVRQDPQFRPQDIWSDPRRGRDRDMTLLIHSRHLCATPLKTSTRNCRPCGLADLRRAVRPSHRRGEERGPAQRWPLFASRHAQCGARPASSKPTHSMAESKESTSWANTPNTLFCSPYRQHRKMHTCSPQGPPLAQTIAWVVRVAGNGRGLDEVGRIHAGAATPTLPAANRLSSVWPA